MNGKKIGLLLCTAVLTAGLIGGCGMGADDKQTEAKGQETQAKVTEAGQAQTAAPVLEETQAAETQAPESETEPLQIEMPDTEEYIDNPAAEGGEGDTNGFYDDAGTWITVYKNANGDWVDESGMVYTFGDDGVTDQNGVFYPY